MGSLCCSDKQNDLPVLDRRKKKPIQKQIPTYQLTQSPQSIENRQLAIPLSTNQQKNFQKFLGELIHFSVLRGIGFQFAKQSNLMQKLNSIIPNGGTALWDSTALGIVTLLQLQKALNQTGLGNNCSWQFIHIVVTDGIDTSSDIPFDELCKIMLKIGLQLPNTICKTIFIGVDLDGQAASKLLALTILGLDTVQIFLVQNQNISKQFDRIKVDFIGVRQQMVLGGGAFAARTQTHIGMSIKKYAIMFNLDMSGSMKGTRWTKVKNAVNNFIGGLCDDDLVCGLAFNNQAKIITK